MTLMYAETDRTPASMPTILHIFSTFNIGGPQLANAWQHQYCHTIIAMDGATNCINLIHSEVPYTLISPPRHQPGLGQRLSQYRTLLKELQPDLLITYNWGAIEWALARWGLPLPHIHIEDGNEQLK